MDVGVGVELEVGVEVEVGVKTGIGLIGQYKAWACGG